MLEVKRKIQIYRDGGTPEDDDRSCGPRLSAGTVSCTSSSPIQELVEVQVCIVQHVHIECLRGTMAILAIRICEEKENIRLDRK